jgi:hypothetical protein
MDFHVFFILETLTAGFGESKFAVPPHMGGSRGDPCISSPSQNTHLPKSLTFAPVTPHADPRTYTPIAPVLSHLLSRRPSPTCSENLI